jgi:hypothetical protein
MNWIVLAFALQFGFSPETWAIMYSPPRGLNTIEQQQFYVAMDAEVRLWDFLYVGGSLGVPMWKSGEGYTFWPSELQSVTRAGVRFGPVEVGWSHLCSHPVVPGLPLWEPQVLWEGGYDEFHVKVSGQIGGKK